MLRIDYSPDFRRDSDDLFDYLFQESPQAAVNAVRAVGRTIETIAANPEIGRGRPDIAPGVRCFLTGTKYLLYYQLLGDESVLLLRLLHTSRDHSAVF